jgi:hypothetical protein
MGCSESARVHHGGQSDERVGGRETAHDRASNVAPVFDRRGPVRQRFGWSDSCAAPSTPLVSAALLIGDDVERVIASCDGASAVVALQNYDWARTIALEGSVADYGTSRRV